MYLPPHFAASDADAARRLIDAHPLATLFHGAGADIGAEHLPLEYALGDGARGVLRGHVARANAVWQRADGQPVLAVFHGPQGYVSPAWYAAKSEHGRVVPTWNYAVVHVRGVLRAVDDAAWLHALVDRLTQRHEAGRAAPWSLADAPAAYIDAMLRAIVGIEIDVVDVTAKFKLSQNRSAADRDGVVAGLRAAGLAALAAQMADGAR